MTLRSHNNYFIVTPHFTKPVWPVCSPPPSLSPFSRLDFKWLLPIQKKKNSLRAQKDLSTVRMLLPTGHKLQRQTQKIIRNVSRNYRHCRNTAKGQQPFGQISYIAFYSVTTCTVNALYLGSQEPSGGGGGGGNTACCSTEQTQPEASGAPLVLDPT